MKKIVAWSGLSLLALLLTASSAWASSIPIGTFAYRLDADFGPVFEITNNSAQPFSLGGAGGTMLDGAVELSEGGVVETLVFGPIDPFGSVTLFLDPASAFTTVGDLRAALRLTFSLPGAVDGGIVTGIAFAFDPNTAIFDGAPLDDLRTITFLADATPTAVPEPASLVLVTSGLLATWRARRRRRGAAA